MRLPMRSLLFPLLLASTASAQTTRNVPAEFAKIQQAIDAAQAGDTVLVAPGTYIENLNFKGKNITVRGSAGAALTVIDGNKAGSVVTFNSGEGNSAILSGFTIRNGQNTHEGGGISISYASPTIQDNIIVENVSCSGLGIAVGFGSPIIQRNVISNNRRNNCSGGVGGGGIVLRGAGSAQILNNVITGHITSASGGGIALWAAGTPTIRGNEITHNTTTREGGGIDMVNASDAVIVGNQITGNSAQSGGGISWLVPSSGSGPVLVNNTIADNDAPKGAGIFADGFDSKTRLVNNIIVAGKSGQTVFHCGDFNNSTLPLLQNNDVFGSNGAVAYASNCGDQTGKNGNISADPGFLARTASGRYRLASGSPVIDVGDNAAPHLSATDLEGLGRIRDGDCDGTATIDLGAIEFQNSMLKLTPTSLDFGEQVVGTVSTPRGVTLQNASCTEFPISSLDVTGDFSSSTTCGSTLAPGGTCEVQMSFSPLAIGSQTGLLEVRGSASLESFQVALSGIGTAIPDAGVPDAGVPDAGSGPVVDPPAGCGCQSGLPSGGATLFGWLLLSLAGFTRSRSRSMR